ncbi:MAG: hypothetical protein HQM09_18580 [Candidatus Riflebacteria bacterium]|nr:hypothetical protein [Candidatus Riflebacteria bacterium]
MRKQLILTAVFIFFICFSGFSSLRAESMFAVESESAKIAVTCQKAAIVNRLVLLKFSAEWCPWCVDMKKIFQERCLISALKGYELVEIDVGKRIMVKGKKIYEKNLGLMKKYAEKIFVPQLIILDTQGRVVARLNPDDYERKSPEGNDPAKLAGLLNHYRRPLK